MGIVRKIIVYIFAIILVSFALFPIVISFLGAITPETELRSDPTQKLWFNKGPTFFYYEYIFGAPFGMEFTQDPYVRYVLRSLVITNIKFTLQIIWNSLSIAAAVAVINIIVGGTAAYAFARLRFPTSTGSFVFILLSRILPPVIVALPYYALCYWFGLTNSMLSLLVVHGVITLPFTTWYLTLFYRTIPIEAEEAALVDGASYFQAFWRIILPIAGPGLVSAGAFAFLLSYNDFLFAQFLIEKFELYTIPLFLASFATATDIYYGIQYAVLALTFIPIILLLAVFWRMLNIRRIISAIKM